MNLSAAKRRIARLENKGTPTDSEIDVKKFWAAATQNERMWCGGLRTIDFAKGLEVAADCEEAGTECPTNSPDMALVEDMFKIHNRIEARDNDPSLSEFDPRSLSVTGVACIREELVKSREEARGSADLVASITSALEALP